LAASVTAEVSGFCFYAVFEVLSLEQLFKKAETLDFTPPEA
jgi:hypothetical protein